MVLLVSSDNKQVNVDKAVAIRSLVIKNMIEDFGGDVEDSPLPIPLPNVTSEVLEKVLEWCEYHKNDPMPNPESPRNPGAAVGEWDAKFIDVDQMMLGEIVLAANYLDIHPLLDIGCSSIAKQIKLKSCEEIRWLFGIQETFTPEEANAIVRQNERPLTPRTTKKIEDTRWEWDPEYKSWDEIWLEEQLALGPGPGEVDQPWSEGSDVGLEGEQLSEQELELTEQDLELWQSWSPPVSESGDVPMAE